MQKKTLYCKKGILFLLLAGICLCACGCLVRTAPVLRPELTPAPTQTPSPTPQPTPEPTPTEAQPSATPVAGVDTQVDALGAYVSEADHFQRYISFEKIQVYEYAEDTFLDGIAISTYPEVLSCGIDVVFFDEDGEEINRARLQTRDGRYVLNLAQGETVLYAQINTDITLLDKDFELQFNETLGVFPKS